MEQTESKNKSRKWFAIGLIAIIAFAIIMGNIFGGEKRDYSQKETITYNNVEYSIKNIEEDDEYISVKFKIKNKGNQTLSYSYMHFVMLNQKGETVDKKSFVTDDGTILSSGELKPNEEVEGIVIWTKNEKNKDLRIRYYENVLMSKIDDYKFQWRLDD